MIQIFNSSTWEAGTDLWKFKVSMWFPGQLCYKVRSVSYIPYQTPREKGKKKKGKSCDMHIANQ